MSEAIYFDQQLVLIHKITGDTTLTLGKQLLGDSIVTFNYILVENDTNGIVEVIKENITLKVAPKSMTELQCGASFVTVIPTQNALKTGEVRVYLSQHPVNALRELLRYTLATDSTKRGYLDSFILNINSLW